MAPFFKSSSLFNISRRRRKDQKSLDTVISSPPALHSRSLPNLEELQGISARFLEEFHPILQPQGVSDPALEEKPVAPVSSESNSPKPDEVSTLAVLASDLEPIPSPEVDSSESDEQSTPRVSVSYNSENTSIIQDESDSPKLDEQTTPRATPATTFEPVSSPENNSVEESTPRPAVFNAPKTIPSLESGLDKQIASSASQSSSSSTPSSESTQNEPDGGFKPQADDFGTSFGPTPSTNCESPDEFRTVSTDGNKPITLPEITHLIPHKATEAARLSTVKTAAMREDESTNFFKELDDFAVFFGVDKPSKTMSLPPPATQTPDCSSKSEVSNLPAVNDCTLVPFTCGHEKIMELYNEQIEISDQRIERLEKSLGDAYEENSRLDKSLADASEENSRLLAARDTMSEEFNLVQSKFHAEWNMNIRLKRALQNNKFDHLKILARQDWEINQMKRFIGAMIDIKLHAPVLFNAAHLVCNGGDADTALISAIKEAATRFDSPWATILPAVIGDRPQEIYLDAIKRCAKLEGERREATKKHQFWKMRAQMDPRHAKSITPSSSTMSIVLDAYLPKETLELNCIDDLLSKLKTGQSPRRSQPPASSSPVIAGPSKFEGAYVAPSSPTGISEGRNEGLPVSAASSSASISEEPKQKMPSEMYIASSPISVHEPNQDMPSEALVASSPILVPEESNQDLPSVMPVALPPVFVPKELCEDLTSESVVLPPMEYSQASPVPIPSPALSGHSSFTYESPARVIRPYIPGRILFGEDGLGIAPPGLFDRDESEDLPGSPALSVGGSPKPGIVESISVSMVRNYVVDHIEQVSYSQESLNLEYIDEIPVDGRANPILRDDSDDNVASEGQEEMPTIVSGITEVSWSPKGDDKPTELLNSASKGSFSSLKRLSASSSKLKQSISSGLKRLRQISFAPNKAEQAEKSATSRHKALEGHRRMASASGKENRPPRSSIPTRGIRRPTVSSALKTIQVSQLPTPTSTARNQVSLESPMVSNITPAGKRVPLSNIPVRLSNSQKANTNAPRKVLDQGRKAVRTLARLIH